MDGSRLPSALMHLFYYQQGLFAEEAEQSSALPEEPRDPWPSVSQESPALQPLAEPKDCPPLPPPSLASEEGASAAGAASSTAPADRETRVRALRERRDELEAKLQEGALRAENEALESKVLKTQEDFLSLQTEFKEMKDQYGERLDGLRLALEEQQSAADSADRRVVCTEDLVRYHQEQKRLMASHWKSQCQMKDERIRYLNLQLTEYTIDWQNLGVQKQTEASLSHEHHCLEDRHRFLLEDQDRRSSDAERLKAQLEEAKAEERSLEEEVAASEAEAESSVSPEQRVLGAAQARREGLRAQRSLLAEWRQRREAEAAQETPLCHQCIWRDELDVREGQLEKISSQLDKTSAALRGAQSALATQRAKHQEMKARFSEAEAQLGECERARVQKQRRCQELRRAEAAMQRLIEAAEIHSTSSTASVGKPESEAREAERREAASQAGYHGAAP